MFLLLTTDGAVNTRIGAERPHSLSFCLQSGGDQERKHKRRRGEYYSIPTSLIIAALKKMLPIGLNMCTPGDQELISVAKKRYSLVSLQGETRETCFAANWRVLLAKSADVGLKSTGTFALIVV